MSDPRLRFIPIRSNTTSAPVASVALESLSYADRGSAIPTLSRQLAALGCRNICGRLLPAREIEVLFDLPLEATLEVYASLLDHGFELTQTSHLRLAELCNIQRHGTQLRFFHRTVRLLVSFLD
jgi:hypothetical protein